jgi:hypothetical protein
MVRRPLFSSLILLSGLILLMAALTAAARQPAVTTAAEQDDAAWLRERGTLIFADGFDREEDGTLAAAIGNGWTSATADRVPDTKQADLDDGVLKVVSAVEAGHQAHIHHEAGFTDGGAIVRFQLPGVAKSETLTVGFVDRQCPGVHAGHLCYALVSSSPPRIQLADYKTGVMDLEIRKRREPFLKAREKLPADLEALLATKTKDLPWQADHEWHELVLVTEGDEMRASLDGRPLGSHRSAGFAHPTKRWFSLLMNPSAWIDDVKVYRVR